MIQPNVCFKELIQKIGLSPELPLIVPEFDEVQKRFREPRLTGACAAIAQGALRLLVVTVFERSYLSRLTFSEVLDQPFTCVVELPVSESELREAVESLYALPAASPKDRAYFKTSYVEDWVLRFEQDIAHRLKSARASLGVLVASSEPDERPQIGLNTKASLRRGLEGLEQYRCEIEPVDLAIASKLGEAREVLEAALSDGDARKTARWLERLDQIFFALNHSHRRP